MRRTVTGIALALLTLGLLTPGSPARAATPAPALTITNSGPLADLAPVSVAGTGLTPGETLSFRQCQHYGDLCTYGPGVSGIVDGSGRLALTATAHRYIDEYMESRPVIDCAYEDCGFAFVRLGDYEDGYLVIAETVGHFAATTPATPSVSVEAAAPLPVVVSTRLLGSGFAPGSWVLSSRCMVSRPDSAGHVGEDCRRSESAAADGHGDVTIPIDLRRFSVDGRDCIDPVWRCSVRLDGPAYGATARAPLVFDPTSVPPPLPTITVSPVEVAHVAGVVTVVGHDFRAAHAVDVGGPGGSTTATTDATGSFTATITVQRYTMGAFHGIDIDPVIDCAAPGACSVGASTGPDDPAASVPITFAHSDDPTLVLDGATVVEGNGETNTAFRVHLDRPTPVPVTFWYLAPSYDGDPDLRYEFGTEEILAGTTELSVPIVVHGDRIDEPDHHTGLKVVELTGAQLSGPPFIPVTVVDDDPRPAVRVGSITVREGNGPRFAFVPVTLDAPSGRDVTAEYVTHHDTARAGSDYVRVRGTLVIPAGQTRGTIPVVVLGDRAHEASERFVVELDGAHNAVIADGTANVTVHDDD